MTRRVTLVPHDGRKSFYGKAYVLEDGNSRTLYSYNTPILRVSDGGGITRLWSGWSATTGRHVTAFCGLNKKGYMALPVGEEVRA